MPMSRTGVVGMEGLEVRWAPSVSGEKETVVLMGLWAGGGEKGPVGIVGVGVRGMEKGPAGIVGVGALVEPKGKLPR